MFAVAYWGGLTEDCDAGSAAAEAAPASLTLFVFVVLLSINTEVGIGPPPMLAAIREVRASTDSWGDCCRAASQDSSSSPG